MEFLENWFDVAFLLSFLGTYLFLAIFRGSKSILRFLFVCTLWATSGIWMVIVPGYGHLFSDNTAFPGAIFPLGGLIYGAPLSIITFITWFLKRKAEFRSGQRN